MRFWVLLTKRRKLVACGVPWFWLGLRFAEIWLDCLFWPPSCASFRSWVRCSLSWSASLYFLATEEKDIPCDSAGAWVCCFLLFFTMVCFPLPRLIMPGVALVAGKPKPRWPNVTVLLTLFSPSNSAKVVSMGLLLLAASIPLLFTESNLRYCVEN